MPQNLSIAVFVLGAVLLLLSLVSGGFKIFGSEVPGAANRAARVVAFVIGLFLIGFALWHYNDAQKDVPKPVTASAPSPATSPAPDVGPPLGSSAPQPKSSPTGAGLNDAEARQVYGEEGTDFGVAPRNSVQQTVSSPTPTSIPGARVITTGELKNAMDAGRSFLLIDVWAVPHPVLPNAKSIPNIGMPYPPYDVATALATATGGDKSVPLVFYCQGASCWESYNAALRAKNAGYANVYWYRGGVLAWSAAGYFNS